MSSAMSGLIERWHRLREGLPTDVTMLAISKYAPDDAVQTLIDAGQRCFGESRPQGLRDRAIQWPECQWHMIGPLQKNKAKYIARHAAMWHSCDDMATATSVSGLVEGRRLPVLMQVNIAGDPGQRGVAVEQLPAFAEQLRALPGLDVCGLMAMASRGERAEQDFLAMRRLRDELFGGSVALLSMGMSSDYPAAVAAGATMVRLGSILFGDLDIRNNRNE